MNTSEKVAYVKGLAEGLGYDNTSKEGKILAAILDILEDVAHDIEDLEENAWDLGEAIDQVSDDLAEIEELVYDEDFDDDEDEDEDYEPCSCCCSSRNIWAARLSSCTVTTSADIWSYTRTHIPVRATTPITHTRHSSARP